MENTNRKHYYIGLYNTEDNTVMFAPNTPKGRATLFKYKTETTKAYKVGAENMDSAIEVFNNNTGFNAELSKIKYSRHIPEVQEVEL